MRVSRPWRNRKLDTLTIFTTTAGGVTICRSARGHGLDEEGESTTGRTILRCGVACRYLPFALAVRDTRAYAEGLDVEP